MLRSLRLAVIIATAWPLLMMPGMPVRAAQEATPAAECVTTTPEENRALVTAYWEEAVWGKQGKIAEIVAPDEVHHWGIAGTTEGFDAFAERWALFNDAFPDLRFTIDQVAVNGDLAASIWTATGTQAGEWQGIPPTNKRVSWSGINIFRIECGQIVESWGEADHIGLRARLGATDVPALPTGDAAATPLSAPAATPCADDSPDANLATARRWTEDVWTGKQLDALGEIADPAILHHGAAFPDVQGIPALEGAIKGQLETFPDFSATVDEAFADGELVVVRWSATGTDEGGFLGLPPSGQQVDFTGINVYRFACGRIVESWSEMNALAILLQIQGAEATPVA